MLNWGKSSVVGCVLALFSTVAAAGQIRPVSMDSEPNLFVWTDTCNVFVLKDGDAALLIDLGDGGVLDHLSEIGVKHVEWVLFTHHHREQCQGSARLPEWRPQIAAPEAERSLFEGPAKFRRTKPTLGDSYTVHGASYVRPPVEPIEVLAERRRELPEDCRERAKLADALPENGQRFLAVDQLLVVGDRPRRLEDQVKTLPKRAVPGARRMPDRSHPLNSL